MMKNLKKRMSLFLMVAILASVSVFVFGNVSKVKAQETPITCTDSDGGRDYFLKGIVDSKCPNNNQCPYEGKSYSDYCLDATILQEYSCGLMPATNETSNVVAEEYHCPYGCKDGACVVITTPSITVLSPNGGEVLEIGKSYKITWKYENINSIKIYIKVSDSFGLGSSSWKDITNEPISASSGYYDWTISEQQLPIIKQGDIYKIVINDPSNPDIKDESNNYFSIISPTVTPQCQSICKSIGTRSEGWYDSCAGTLIKYDNCSGTTECVKEGKSLGAVVPDNNKQCCEGLKPYIPADASGIRIIGTRGICKKISDSQEIDIPYKDGTLLRAKNGKQVYFVDDEKLRPINSFQTFKNYGFKAKDVKNIASNEMKKYEIDDEALLPYPDGTLLKVNGRIYFVQDEKLRYISSFKIFRAHGFKIKNVINVANNIIDEYEMGENLLPYPSGTLLKVANRLYLVQGDELRYISSLKAFRNLKRKNIIIVAPEIIDEFEEGEELR